MTHMLQSNESLFLPEYERLIGHHHETGVEMPQLAESWSVAANGKDWTWKLRRNVPFNKGGKPTGLTFTAKDLLLSWQLRIGDTSIVATPHQQSGQWTGRLGTPESWKIVNDYEVTMTTPSINLDLPLHLSDELAAGIVSKDHFDQVGGEKGYFEDPVGTGPFTINKFTINEGIIHDRVENHWRQTPDFPQLEWVYAKEDATRLAMLKAGEAHIVSIPRILRNDAISSGMMISKSTLPGFHTGIHFPYYREENYIDPATGQPPAGGRPAGVPKGYDPNDPLRNKLVRQAINHAINRDEVNEVYFLGEGFPAISYFPQWRDDFKDEWAPIPGPEGKTGKEGGWPYPYDPAKAKQLLTEAGYPNGFDTTFVAFPGPAMPEAPDMAEQMVTYLNAVGIRAKLEIVENSGAIYGRAREATHSNFMWLFSESLDPACTFPEFSWYESGRGRYEWKEMSDFKLACNVTTDPVARRNLASDFGTWWLENAVNAPLLWIFGEAAYNPAYVAEFKINMLHVGPVRYPEYTKAVFK
jgi:ABC-type transport system substrate-binding protein